MKSDDRRSRLVAAGHWLRAQRERRGYMKAVDFARDLGVDASLISQYERGVNAVTDDRAEQIATLLGTDLIETRRNLGLWVPDLPEPPDPDEEPTDQEIRDSALQPETKAALLEMRQTIREWERRRDKAAIQRASRVIKALDDEGNEGQAG